MAGRIVSVMATVCTFRVLGSCPLGFNKFYIRYTRFVKGYGSSNIYCIPISFIDHFIRQYQISSRPRIDILDKYSLRLKHPADPVVYNNYRRQVVYPFIKQTSIVTLPVMVAVVPLRVGAQRHVR